MHSFRTRTLVITGMTLACTIGILFYTTYSLFQNHLAKYERESMLESLAVARNGLGIELADLAKTAADWGHWDETYRLMSGKPGQKEEYYESNLSQDALQNLDLDFMLFFDGSGVLSHWAMSADRTPTKAVVPRDIVKTLVQGNPLTTYDRRKPKHALVRLAGGRFALVGYTGIYPSDVSGEPTGTFMLGRFLDASVLHRLSDMTRLDIAIKETKPTTDVERVRTDSGILRGRTAVPAIEGPEGTPVSAMVDVVKDRAFFLQGSAAMIYFLLPLGLVTLLTSLVLMQLLDKSILRKVDKLNDGMAPFGKDRNKSGVEGLANLDLAIQGVISMYERSPIGIAVFDSRGITSHANKRLEELTGDTHSSSIRDLFLEHEWSELLSPDHPIKECQWGDRTVECLITPLGESEGMFILQAQDVTDRRSYQLTMEHQARHDALTNLPNRRMFEEEFNEFLHNASGGAAASVLFMDLDNFKNVNDAMGHQAGDLLLQAIAGVLVKVAGPNCLVSRIGGDEFIVMDKDGGTREKASRLAAKIIEAVRQPIFVHGQVIYTTVSIGISLIPDDGTESDPIIRRADSALYEAKGSRNCYRFYEPDMEKASQRRLQLKAGLAKALENDELVAFYQPQVDVGCGRVIGVEALVRWQHPTLGMLPPSEFLPLAEEMGLINLVDEWVLRTACLQLKAWHAQGFDGLRMSVNLSAKQFLRADLVDSLEGILKETGLEPKDLELEITESTAMFSETLTCDVLERLKGIGIRASLDDFGMGYSNLSYLKQFPLSSLKIPREFVRNTPTAADNVAIVSAVTSMAHSFNLPVVAEGVEVLEELNFISETGCDAVQGYYFSPPKPPEVITEYLKENRQYLKEAAATREG